MKHISVTSKLPSRAQSTCEACLALKTYTTGCSDMAQDKCESKGYCEEDA